MVSSPELGNGAGGRFDLEFVILTNAILQVWQIDPKLSHSQRGGTPDILYIHQDSTLMNVAYFQFDVDNVEFILLTH